MSSNDKNITCIWCKQKKIPSLEHVIPKALLYSDELTINCVCRKCNNKLSKVDKAVISEFEQAKFTMDMPGRNGKPPKLNLGNIKGYTKNGEKRLHINMDKKPVKTLDGISLSAYGKSNKDVKAELALNGNMGKVTWSQTLGNNKTFIRGICKIAYEAVAYRYESEILTDDKFNNIRNFVLTGAGSRTIIIGKPSINNYSSFGFDRIMIQNGNDIVQPIWMFGIKFIVDLTPEEKFIPEIKEIMHKRYGTKNWSWLPI